jgi:hypothetical protein
MELATAECKKKFFMKNLLFSGTQIFLKKKDLVIAQTRLGA